MLEAKIILAVKVVKVQYPKFKTALRHSKTRTLTISLSHGKVLEVLELTGIRMARTITTKLKQTLKSTSN